jgi:hypothetical protein
MDQNRITIVNIASDARSGHYRTERDLPGRIRLTAMLIAFLRNALAGISDQNTVPANLKIGEYTSR